MRIMEENVVFVFTCNVGYSRARGFSSARMKRDACLFLMFCSLAYRSRYNALGWAKIINCLVAWAISQIWKSKTNIQMKENLVYIDINMWWFKMFHIVLHYIGHNDTIGVNFFCRSLIWHPVTEHSTCDRSSTVSVCVVFRSVIFVFASFFLYCFGREELPPLRNSCLPCYRHIYRDITPSKMSLCSN